ncbi:MAG: hypothetical protein EOP17_15505 [Rhizobiaceae bacterium]|nr:MAG: hypothetical protein EOP17_15505 [Rhizobiaceae bacterium]
MIEPKALTDLRGIDVIVAAGLESQAVLVADDSLRSAVRGAAARGAAFLFVDRAPSAFNDFAFGLSDDWFAASQSPEFPVGRLATTEQVTDLLTGLGFAAPLVEEKDVAEGLLIVAGASSAAADQLQALPSIPSALVFAEDVARAAAFGDGDTVVLLSADADETAISQSLARFDGKAVQAIFLAERLGDREASDVALARLENLKRIVEAFTRHSASLASGDQSRLVIVAPGGSPLAGEATDDVNAGLWTFARVLQNEYDAVATHLLDLETDSAELGLYVGEILASASANREWILRDGSLSEIRASSGPFGPKDTESADFTAATIRQTVNGRVDSIIWESASEPVPDADEIVLAVEAAGLNFRDVMWAMGLLPEEALEDGFAGATIGMEMSGRVISVGASVTDLVAGDRVMGIGPAATAARWISWPACAASPAAKASTLSSTRCSRKRWNAAWNW